ncbi:acyl carrier protein [Lentimicrobium sp. L6]|uniref:acyl carrier protein n=1 Tax=Lentimicrobium sp. L6 TaxID=2735916 RepID=UPI001553C035|nr:acyl carrier protein [Lentimicrobium sp. L6]NPD86986.1 acyl carrier protein [Lentimicrobium sp. L6]
MEKTEIVNKLTFVFRKIFNNNSLIISNELTANDVEGWDSLTHMLLVSEVENTFSIKFKLKDLNKMKNVGDMVEIISSKF